MERDMRDPSALGAALLGCRSEDSKPPFVKPLSWLADNFNLDVVAYDPGDSTARETHRRYHDELQERARAGDRYAKSMLLGHAYDEGDDQ